MKKNRKNESLSTRQLRLETLETRAMLDARLSSTSTSPLT